VCIPNRINRNPESADEGKDCGDEQVVWDRRPKPDFVCVTLRPLLLILLKIGDITPMPAIVTWTPKAIKSSSEPIPHRQIRSTTLTMSGRMRLPAYFIAMTKGEEARLEVLRSSGSVYGTRTEMKIPVER